MQSPEEFPHPTKIRFAARSNCDVGAVFADRLVRNETEVSFYLGQIRVAVLGQDYLVIGSRKIPRSSLHPEKPFFVDDSQPEDQPFLSRSKRLLSKNAKADD